VPVQDENALARTILEVLADSALRVHLGSEAKRRAEVFALEKITQDYRRIFSENSSYSL